MMICWICERGFESEIAFHAHLMTHPGRSEEEVADAVELLGADVVTDLQSGKLAEPGESSVEMDDEPEPEAEPVVTEEPVEPEQPAETPVAPVTEPVAEAVVVELAPEPAKDRQADVAPVIPDAAPVVESKPAG